MSAPLWRRALPALLVVIAAILVAQRETALAMAGIWARSDTFAHGFLVPPIALWLIWRQRGILARLTPRPAPVLLLPFLGAGLVWLLGELAEVNAVTQFALVAQLVLAVPVVLGLAVARVILFPLGFLFFAVPFGEFAMPQLMEWTAQFTVLGLRLSGIPVYREGLHFVIPSGQWSVVEACSGVRYLIASVTVGTLFAYLNYRSIRRRLLFVAVAIAVPIVANWMRAYLIVLLGHLSGNRLAVGVDHLIYGWVFFGLVILAMFWIGARWREDEAPPPDAAVATNAPVATAAFVRTALPALLLCAVWPLLLARIEAPLPGGAPHLAAPALPAAWTPLPVPAGDWRPVLTAPDATASFAWQGGATAGQPGRDLAPAGVGVHLAYYRNQDRQRKLVSSQNALVRSGDAHWIEASRGSRDASSLPPLPARVRTAELSGNGTRLLVWHWYWVDGRFTASDLHAKLLTVRARLFGRGDDAALVAVYTEQAAPGEGAEQGRADDADARLATFLRDAAPVLGEVLERARAGQGGEGGR